MIHFSLFSGIGGFEIAAEAMGWKNFLSCDINEFGNQVREYYWPDAYHHKNVKDLNYETIHAELSKRFGPEWRSEDIILTGGFPCQPYSVAGKQLGTEDDRHLWPEMLRVIGEVQPRWIVGENVRGLINWAGGVVFDQVQTDLEAQGYEVLAFMVPACAVDAPHRRDRVWFIAYTESDENNRRGQRRFYAEFTGVDAKRTTSNAENAGQQARPTGQTKKQFRGGNEPVGTRQWEGFPTQPPVCGGDDELSSKLDGITFPK